MMLLQRCTDHVEILTSRKKRIVSVLVNGVEMVSELILDDKVDSGCFGTWYMMDCLSNQDITLKDSESNEYSFPSYSYN